MTDFVPHFVGASGSTVVTTEWPKSLTLSEMHRTQAYAYFMSS